MEFYEPITGIVVEIPDVPPADRLDEIVLREGFVCDDGAGAEAAAMRAIIASPDLAELLPAGVVSGEITLKPLTWDPRRRAVYDSETGPTRVFDLDEEGRFVSSLRWAMRSAGPAPNQLVIGDHEYTRREMLRAGPPSITVKDYAVDYGGTHGPASRSLPRRKIRDGETGELLGKETMIGGNRAFEFSDGTVTNAHGQPLIRSRKDSERAEASSELERTDRGDED